MKKLLGAILAILLTTTWVTAQDMSRTFTRPSVPPREALDRLNLKVGWQAAIPMDSTRDGLATFQMAGKQILVQTRSGLITALDRETGQSLWRNRVGKPYETTQPLGWNTKSVFVAHGTWLYGLDRNTGQVQWKYSLPDAVAAGVAADDDRIYLALGVGRISVYILPEISRREIVVAGTKSFLPKIETPQIQIPSFYGGSSGSTSGVGPLSGAIQASRDEQVGPRPIHQEDLRAGSGVELGPLLTPIEMVWATSQGTVLVLPKSNEFPIRPYRFPTDGHILGQPGQYGEYAYIASTDGNLYALHITTGRTIWRFTGGNPIAQKPAVTNEDVYVAPANSGLHRIDRITGQVLWKNATAQRFLATNPKFVYAADRSGRLMVLDRARGTDLSTYDGTRGYVMPLFNEMSDRLFLAAHDGSLVCLHDRDYGNPVTMKEEEEKLFPPPPKPGVKIPVPPPKPEDKVPGKPDDKMPGKPGEKPEEMKKP